MTKEQATVILDTLLDVDSLNITDKAKAQISEAIETLKALARESKNGYWVATEHTEYFEGGGSILVRGYECSECKGFTRKKTGVKEYCSLCGSKNTLEIIEEVK